MLNGKKILALIPARGGSKGLPGKNVAAFGGKPMIAWAVEVAKKSSFIDRVIVSTDDARIRIAATDAGADAPFVRPAALATDEAVVSDVIAHALDALSETYDYIVLLQPTSPLRTADDIDTAIALCEAGDGRAAVTVTRASKPPEWMYYKTPDNRLSPVLGINSTDRRQDLAEVFVPNGAVYVAEIDWYLETRNFMSPATVASEMPAERSVDIDTELDLLVAQLLLDRNPDT